MTDYEKPCNNCTLTIRMSNRTGKWLPYDLRTDEAHQCKGKREREESKQQPEEKPATVPLKGTAMLKILINEDIMKLESNYRQFANKARTYGGNIQGCKFQSAPHGYIIAIFYEIPNGAVGEMEK